MAVPTFYTFPQAITSGETTRLSLSFGDFPAGTWTGSLILNQIGSTAVTIAGTASGTAFLFTITATISAAMAAGQWTWAVRVTDGASGDVGLAQAGDFTVMANYSDTITKSIAQQQLDAANAALLVLVANPEATTSFNGQSFTKDNQFMLLGVIDRLKASVNAENARAAGLRGDAPTRSIRPYFC